MLWVKTRWNRLVSKACLFLLSSVLPAISKRLIAMQHKAADVVNRKSNKAAMRLTVCEQCPMYTKLKTCSACNCYMPIKTQMELAACPKGRW